MDYFKENLRNNISDTDTILDIGCGNKDKTSMFKKENVTSLDAWDRVSPDICLDLSKEKLPYKDNSFDVILMIDFIEHIEKNRGIELIEECKKIVRKKIILFTPLIWSDNSINVNNPDLWCFGNIFDYHKSLWSAEDFVGWGRIPFEGYFYGFWNKGL